MDPAEVDGKRSTAGLFLGIDIGSTTIKAVLINANRKVHHSLYQRTKPTERPHSSCGGRCSSCGTCHLGSVRETIRDFLVCAGVTAKDVCARWPPAARLSKTCTAFSTTTLR